MNTTDAGRLGEVKALARLAEHGWYPFIDLSGKCPIDIIAWKDGVTKTFQVKTTDVSCVSGYTVQIGSVRPNRTGNTIKKFDNTSVDYLVVYVISLDKIAFVPALTVVTGRTMTVTEAHFDFVPE